MQEGEQIPPSTSSMTSSSVHPASLSAIESKIEIGRSKKDSGDVAFKEGDVKSALRAYHEALMYFVGIDRTALSALGIANNDSDVSEKERNEVDVMVEKIHANTAACHIKQGNWKRALETAEKALAKNPANSKALFRKAKAQGELGFIEKAEETLLEAKKISSPAEVPLVEAELARLRALDRERQKAADQRMRGFLSRGNAA
ncbi:hypothetical protein SCLCIDRAFT_1210202 [Scleroderma citrinum Foug A]|uniref:Uncharacterized protein n=1 Tax=Scleroderma citrinum Foug A TaxID=1036808 RepID=A0A0C3E410_9AGAM|nr:hypothetical protein SCLCIDRAFT_1210202 [Scleroderma citrinum Foug A]